MTGTLQAKRFQILERFALDSHVRVPSATAYGVTSKVNRRFAAVANSFSFSALLDW